MITPLFLNPPNADQYFNLHQDYHHQGDQQQHVLEISPFCPTVVSSRTCLHLDQGLSSATHSMSDQSQAFNDQLEASKTVLFGESPSYGAQVNSTNTYGLQNHDVFVFKQQQEDQEQNNLINSSGGITTDNNGSSLRWMSSKMRMMRKMINSSGPKIDPVGGSRTATGSNDQDHHCHQPGINTTPNNINNDAIRVCYDCNTTRTPLWRSGPQGPKSLCNACGIRQRKARKAVMEAAAAATNIVSTETSYSTSSKTTAKLMIAKDKKRSRATSKTCVFQQRNKKQTPCKQQTNQLPESDHNTSSASNTTSSKRQLCFEEFAVNLLSKNAALHRMFPQDEEEGALLLMALSYGLIQS